MDEDPFNSLLGLEDEYYNEGYTLGEADGQRAGHIEGRLFGLEKGFEKYLEMGKLHGRSIIWGSRLPNLEAQPKVGGGHTAYAVGGVHGENIGQDDAKSHQSRNSPVTGAPGSATASQLPALPGNLRIKKHLQTFHALVEPESLSTSNNEDSVSDFDDRLKRAQGKAKIIEKLIGEEGPSARTSTIVSPSLAGDRSAGIQASGDGSIEDVSSLQARH